MATNNNNLPDDLREWNLVDKDAKPEPNETIFDKDGKVVSEGESVQSEKDKPKQ